MSEDEPQPELSGTINCLFNAESLRPPLTGIGRYTWELMAALNQHPRVRSLGGFTDSRSVDFDALSLSLTEEPSTIVMQRGGADTVSEPIVNKQLKRAVSGLRSLVRAVPGAYQLRSQRINRHFSKHCANAGWDIYHEPNFILKPFPGPCVTTIHDLSFIRYPKYHPRERVAWLTRELPRTLKRADAIVTDSQLIKAELIDLYDVPEEKITPIYLAASSSFKSRSVGQLSSVMSRYLLNAGRYILCVSTIEPRKGIDSLLCAWERLPASYRKEHELVIVGGPGWGNNSLLAKIHHLQEKGGVRYLSYVAQQDLPFIYNGAKVFVYPSIYEGFGLPVLEAMQSGVATICRAGTSAAEFAADGALQFDTDETLADALRQLLSRESLREAQSLKGLAQALLFSWEQCADQTLSVYESILSNVWGREQPDDY